MKILIVDDKQENLSSAKKELGSIKGLELVMVSTFEAATDLLKNLDLKFDGVFTDCMMPGEARGVSSSNIEIGKDVPYGLIISIMAKNSGIDNICVVTDLSNHHAGPIPWALDQISSTDTHIKCVRTKDWLKAYKNCFGEPEYEQKAEVKNKKLLVLDRSYPKSKLDHPIGEFDVVKTSCKESDFLIQLVGDNKPTHVHIIGEMGEGIGLECFRKVKALGGDYKIIVSGFLPKPTTNEFDNITYLRLPFSPSEFEAAFNS